MVLLLVAFNFHGCFLLPETDKIWVSAQDTALIFRTSDFGNTWDTIPSGSSYGLFDVLFLDSLKGWISGMAGEIKVTADGGNIWSRQSIGLSKFFTRLFFLDSLNGWASGGDGIVIKTTDGGKNWTQYFTAYDSIDFYGIHFIDTLNGWVVGGRPTEPKPNGVILKSTDGGAVWNEVIFSNTYDFLDVFFINSDTGWVAGGDSLNHAVILKTTDGGAHWDTIFPPSYYLRSLDFYSSKIGWASGMFGTVIKTEDGGNTWVLKNTGAISTLFDIDFSDSLKGVCVGQDVILLTTDGGEQWNINGIEEHHNREERNIKSNRFNKGIYDIMGRKINRIKHSGIYFRNGKKVLIIK